MICYTDNADQDEQADTFYNLNNGQSLNAATMNRVKAKSKDQIISLGKHKIFADSLSQTDYFVMKAPVLFRKSTGDMQISTTDTSFSTTRHTNSVTELNVSKPC